jgi:hypothetical protein
MLTNDKRRETSILSGSRHSSSLTPRLHGRGSKDTVRAGGGEMTLKVEGIVGGRVKGQKSLGWSGTLESLHLALPSLSWLMRVLCSVSYPTAPVHGDERSQDHNKQPRKVADHRSPACLAQNLFLAIFTLISVRPACSACSAPERRGLRPRHRGSVLLVPVQ